MPFPKERIYTSDDYWNLPDGQRVELIDGKLYAIALREYWIVNPRTSSTTVYNFEVGEPGSYPFEEAIPAGILDGLNIVFANLL